jgi:hypothetical protein
VFLLASCQVATIMIPALFVAGFAASLIPYFVLRCPRCRVHFDPGIGSGLFSKSSTRRFQFCPGCAVRLDAQVSGAPAAEALLPGVRPGTRL